MTSRSSHPSRVRLDAVISSRCASRDRQESGWWLTVWAPMLTPGVAASRRSSASVRQRWALRDYLRGGGILIADAMNSSKEFDAWFKEMVGELFVEDKWDVLDDRSVLFAATSPEMVAIQETALRQATQQAFGEQTKPKIYALITRTNPRVRILYSPFDLTLGYLGTTTSTFSGYAPESAERLGRNLIMYAAAVAGAGK